MNSINQPGLSQIQQNSFKKVVSKNAQTGSIGDLKPVEKSPSFLQKIGKAISSMISYLFGSSSKVAPGPADLQQRTDISTSSISSQSGTQEVKQTRKYIQSILTLMKQEKRGEKIKNRYRMECSNMFAAVKLNPVLNVYASQKRDISSV